jgi:hypothetical protein
MNGVMCLAQVYEFEGVQFEIARWGEPIRLRKDGEPYKRQSNAFFDLYDRFCALSDEEKQACKICGGCYSFDIGEE